MYLLDFIPFYCFDFLHYIEENCKFLEKVKKRVYTFLYLIFFKKIEKFKKMHLLNCIVFLLVKFIVFLPVKCIGFYFKFLIFYVFDFC